ncbi:hypothetical protein SEA_PINKIEPIE_211 [Streptomyces phage PinkiePie]|nr:hypothetical protein SEA_SQUILLIUM_214 [Streptomyces phage Squillium]WNM73433.1 hypothetical protein SEA_LIANDRY_211 [Streptomyces phage Liandry]WNM74834.1 hypothetical protein SEA_PINKIEPIE_211 [Streptomyces phage PinkiePie]
MATGEGPVEATRLEWHYLELQEFVKNLWGVEWEGGAAMGFPAQDTYYDVEVDYGVQEGDELKLWIDDYTFEEAKAAIEKFKAEGMPREEYAEPGAQLLLNWLSYEGHIPAGNYRILVWW